MRHARKLLRRFVLLLPMFWLGVAASPPASSEPVQGAEDLFDSLGVHRPLSPTPAPDLALPTPEGRTIDIKDFTGKVVLLGFFTTT